MLMVILFLTLKLLMIELEKEKKKISLLDMLFIILFVSLKILPKIVLLKDLGMIKHIINRKVNLFLIFLES